MIPRKYLDDYKVVEQVDERGRTRKEAVYVGGDFVFAPPLPKKERWIIGGLCLAAIIAYAAALVPATRATRMTYVMVPFILTPVPLYLMAVVVITLLRADDIMIRYDAERISQRLAPCAIIAAILPAASFIGLVIAYMRSIESFQSGDLIFCIMSVVSVAASAVVFKMSRRVKAVRKT